MIIYQEQERAVTLISRRYERSGVVLVGALAPFFARPIVGGGWRDGGEAENVSGVSFGYYSHLLC